jgi:hypothetical protein
MTISVTLLLLLLLLLPLPHPLLLLLRYDILSTTTIAVFELFTRYHVMFGRMLLVCVVADLRAAYTTAVLALYRTTC